jgi:hypothetical protein
VTGIVVVVMGLVLKYREVVLEIGSSVSCASEELNFDSS